MPVVAVVEFVPLPLEVLLLADVMIAVPAEIMGEACAVVVPIEPLVLLVEFAFHTWATRLDEDDNMVCDEDASVEFEVAASMPTSSMAEWFICCLCRTHKSCSLSKFY